MAREVQGEGVEGEGIQGEGDRLTRRRSAGAWGEYRREMQARAWRLLRLLAAGLCLGLFPLALCLIAVGFLLAGAWAVVTGFGLIVLVCGLLLWVEDDAWWAERRAGAAPVVPITAGRRGGPVSRAGRLAPTQSRR